LPMILGNLVSRTVTMIDKYFSGIIPKPSTEGEHDAELKELAVSDPTRS
jgi:methionyl-tRNA synthetase